MFKDAASKTQYTLAQSRRGRRPMRVSTLLRKDKEGTLFKRSVGQVTADASEVSPKLGADLLPGGLADKKKPGDFSAASLRQGMRVESEHTSRPALAREITMDHLTEDPGYYTKLKKMERGKEAVAASLQTRWRRLLERRGENSDGSLKYASSLGTNKDGFKLQGRTKFQGLTVDIENRKGSVREGTNDDGSKWRTKFKLPYGYIRGTKGADGDEVDAYVGPDRSAPDAFVVRQKTPSGKYDEDTVMLGFAGRDDARKAILKHYDDPSLIGKVVRVSMDSLKQQVASGKKLVKISAMPGQALLEWGAGEEPSRVEGRRPPPKRRGDVPDRDIVRTAPFVEERQTSAATVPADPFLSAGPQQVSKYAKQGDVPTKNLSPNPAERVRIEGPHVVLSDISALPPSTEGKMAFVTTDYRAHAGDRYLGFFGELDKLAEQDKEAFREALRSLASRFARPAELRGAWGHGGLGKGLAEGGAMLRGPVTKGLSAGESAVARQIRPTSVAHRVAGETAHAAGHHLQHSSGLKKALNPLGVPLGGAIEGFTRGVGKELQGTGSNVARRIGSGMVQHAGKAGLVGEIGSVGALGAAAHIPLSAAGVLGGKLAPALSALGETAGHIGQDAVGTAAQRVMPRLGQFAGRAAGLLGRAAPAVGSV